MSDISVHFDMSPDAVRGMLSHWIRKGQVVCEQSGCAKGCASCSPEQLEIYRLRSDESLIPSCNISG